MGEERKPGRDFSLGDREVARTSAQLSGGRRLFAGVHVGIIR